MRRSTAFVCLLLPAASWAQEGVVASVWGVGPYLFFAVIAGLILALGFQLVLTNLSLAAGVASVAPLEPSAPAERTGPAARKAITGVGTWAVVTASIALFFASWLAVEVSTTLSVLVGAVLGLVIWGLFNVVMVGFEKTAVTSLVGSISRAASQSLRVVYEAVSEGIVPAPRHEAEEVVLGAVQPLRQEVERDLDLDELREEVRQIVARLEPERRGLRHDLQILFNDPRLNADQLLERLNVFDRGTLRALVASARTDLTQEDTAELVERIEAVRDEAIRRAERMREEVSRRLETARQETLRQADEARQSASAAAWWAFGTAVASGTAAALGGIVAVVL